MLCARRIGPTETANPALVVLEATGGYEEELLAVLIAAGIETRRVNPREVHHFARAAGQLAKTDRVRRGPHEATREDWRAPRTVRRARTNTLFGGSH
jgi:transposase